MAQTLRRLRGRQPLWAWGVTSRTEMTSSPAAWRERIAVSRPEPGPLGVGERDDRVVERSLDVGLAHGDVLAGLAAARAGSARGRHYFLAAFFLPATCIRRGPLRVRALVLVRWPRTGRPRRWRR